VAEPPDTARTTFNVAALAATTAHHLMAGNAHLLWLRGHQLERWLLDFGIARPNADGEWYLTDYGRQLVAIVARLHED
jgi:hypothetical protein